MITRHQQRFTVLEVDQIQRPCRVVAHVSIAQHLIKSRKRLFLGLDRSGKVLLFSFNSGKRNQGIGSLQSQQIVARVFCAQLTRQRDHLTETGTLKADAAQEYAAERLQSLYQALKEYRPVMGRIGWRARAGRAPSMWAIITALVRGVTAASR